MTLRSELEALTSRQLTRLGFTSFNELHGDLGSLPEGVDGEAERLYVHAEAGGEDVWALLDASVPTVTTRLRSGFGPRRC